MTLKRDAFGITYVLQHLTGDSSKTKADSIEANTIELSITARPIESSANLILRVIAGVGDTNYATFPKFNTKTTNIHLRSLYGKDNSTRR